MDWRVPLADLNYGPEEESAILEVINSRWLTMGSVTKQFEQAFAEYLNVKYAFAVSNATVALHLANLVLGIGPGDDVIVPSLTFVASSNAVLYSGADVKFAEIVSENDLTISPKSIEELIIQRTKAIMVVHYGGYPCHMVEIMALAKRYNLAVIEDAAHAPGAMLNNLPLGTWGDVGCFSFFSNKNLSTGEGGMIVTNRQDLAEAIQSLRSHGMTSLTWDRHQGHAYSYDVVDLGYNYRIDELRSALGLAQLKKLKVGNEIREDITRQYWEILGGHGFTLPFIHPIADNYQSSFHIFPLLLPQGVDRKKFIDCMRTFGIQTSIHYPPIHQFSYYRERYPGVMLPITESIAQREVTLPLFPGMTDEMVTYVAKSAVIALSESV